MYLTKEVEMLNNFSSFLHFKLCIVRINRLNLLALFIRPSTSLILEFDFNCRCDMSSGLALLASYSDEESEEEKSQTVERVIKLRVCDI
jgi:hypothetical protein